ncbi:F-box protein SKIP23-like [Vicia villosa]|uniref:F-box protein SKIP23-like n=1 Tax=Vicia villosa TaxID=3911 RepID=UPI00273C7C49|nr:F-box protein SKIP23-like [Vicia villosa]
MERDWTSLDSLALNMVLEKLIEPIHHIWFRSVCKNWHSIATLNHRYNIQFRSNMLPMLMIPSEKSTEKRNLYSVVANRVYPLELTMLNKKRCCGSSYGWLATVDVDHIITWVNPFKDVAPIILPWIDIYMKYRDYEFNIHKVTLSADPITSPDDYVVAAIYTNRGALAFIKAGQEVWTYIQENHHFGFIDITFYKGLVYAVTRWKKIVSFELCYSSDPHDIFGRERRNPNVVLQTNFDEVYSPLTYLVKSLEGELWMVRRFITREEDNINKGTKHFHVFKLELDEKGEKIIQLLKLKSLGDNVLFVGDGDSTSISASYFSSYLQKDSIYYSDNYFDDEPNPYPQGPFDLGIYNVKQRSFGLHCPYKSYFKNMAPPIWIAPCFKWD